MLYEVITIRRKGGKAARSEKQQAMLGGEWSTGLFDLFQDPESIAVQQGHDVQLPFLGFSLREEVDVHLV